LVRELYRRHGDDLNFLGVVVGRGWQDTQFLKERQGWMMARVARLMGAQVAIVSADMSGTGGNNTIDFMQTIKACEYMGLRTVAILQEAGNPDGTDPTLVDYVPEADALVSVGGVGWHAPAAPAVDRVIGGPTVQPSIAQDPLDASGPLQVESWYGAIWKRSELGMSAEDA
jgi:glycine reductase